MNSTSRHLIPAVFLAVALLATLSLHAQPDYGVGSRADNKIDTLIDFFFQTRYSDVAAAREAAVVAEKLAREAHDHHYFAVATECIGLADYYTGNFDGSRHYLLKALYLYQDEQSHRGISSVCNNLALIEQDQGNLSKAIHLYSIAVKADSLSGDTTGRGYTLNNLATAYIYKGELKPAARFLQKARELAEITGDYELKLNTMVNTALLYQEEKQFQEALALYDVTMQMALAEKDRFSEIIIMINLGDVYLAMRNYPKALRQYESGLKMAHQLDSPELVADCLTNMGKLDQQEMRFNQANERFQQALKIYEELGSKKKIGSVFTAMGINFLGKGSPDKALEYFAQSLSLVEPLGVLPEMAANYQQMSLAWAALQQFDSAMVFSGKYAESLILMRTDDADFILPELPDSIAQRLKAMLCADNPLKDGDSSLEAKKQHKGMFGLDWRVPAAVALVLLAVIVLILYHRKRLIRQFSASPFNVKKR